MPYRAPFGSTPDTAASHHRRHRGDKITEQSREFEVLHKDATPNIQSIDLNFSLKEAKCLALNRRNTYKTSIIVNSILNIKTETQWTLKWTLKWNNLIRTHTQKNGMGGLGRNDRCAATHPKFLPVLSLALARLLLRPSPG